MTDYVCRIHEWLQQPSTAERFRLGERTIQTLVGELDTMGLVDTWMESEGRGDRAMAVKTTFDSDGSTRPRPWFPVR